MQYISCLHKTAILNKPGEDENLNIIFAFGFIIPVKITLVLKRSTFNQIFLDPQREKYYKSAGKTDLRLSLVPNRLYALCYSYRWAGSDFVGRFGLFQTNQNSKCSSKAAVPKTCQFKQTTF